MVIFTSKESFLLFTCYIPFTDMNIELVTVKGGFENPFLLRSEKISLHANVPQGY